MDDATEELYLQKVEELVHDEDLIVSTEVLCRKLYISINNAKHLLQKYLTDHRNLRPAELGVHYVILGKLEKEDKLCLSLVAEEDIDTKLLLFKSGYSKEIYSVQKARSTDINTLNLINVDPREKALLGSIIGKNCVVSKQLINKPNKISTQNKRNQEFKSEKNSISVEKKMKLDEIIVEKKPSLSKTKISNRLVQNGKGIANLFSKLAENPKMPDKKSHIEPKSKISEEKPKHQNAFSEERKPNSSESKQTKPLSKLIDTYDQSDDDKIIEQVKKEPVTSKKTTPTHSKKTCKKRSRKEDTPEKSQKRRKRVIEVSDSDDDIFGKVSDDEDTDLLSSGNEVPQEPIVKPLKIDPFASKNKKKKYVDKSYVDEEGYMVTKKEWVTVSGSEDDEPQKEQDTPGEAIHKAITKKIEDKPAKKQVEEKKEPSTVAKAKGKNAKKGANQPSILSFFSKK